jgi:beta-lactamase superfamily II metal-dependent hydrolase
MNGIIFKNIRKIRILLLVVAVATLYCINVYAQPSVAALTGNPLGATTMDVYFVDVNQGNCVLIKLPSGKFMLYDAGSTSSYTDPNAVADSITKYTGGVDITTIFLSHPDDDHINLIPFIREAKKPKYLHISGDITDYKLIQTWLKALPATTDTVTYIPDYSATTATLDIDGGAGVDVYILAANVKGDDNTASIVIAIDYDETTVILTGDATAKTERRIMQEWDEESLKATVLEFGHHGSNYSSLQLFLDAVQPNIGIFSASAEHMGYGHPRCQLVNDVEVYLDENGKAGITIPTHQLDCWDTNTSQYVSEDNDIGIYLTHTQGTILFRTDGENYAVYVDKLKP